MSYLPDRPITRGRPSKKSLITYGHEPGELDVTCKVWDKAGNAQLVNGILKDAGTPVHGFTLDHEAESAYDYDDPIVDLELLPNGLARLAEMVRIRAWFNTVKGPHTVLDTKVDGKVAEKLGYHLHVAGQPL